MSDLIHAASIASARFRGDVDLLGAIKNDTLLKQQLQRTELLRRRSKARAYLLSEAVRVHVNLIPNVARSFQRMRSLLNDDKPLEAYVFSQPTVNAFVTQASNRYLVAVSSGAVNLLSAEELEFVIGHELGHAAFGHLEVPAEAAIELGPLSMEQCMLVRAWQRASEISADRVGLVCCNSLEVAATALFKVLCGLNLPGLVIDPNDFANQWDGLVEEVVDHGNRDYWQLAHPFPPLRMKALMLFWQNRGDKAMDTEVTRLLAHMDSSTDSAASNHDPLLARFCFWGALYVALADSEPDARMLQRFQTLVPPGIDLTSLLGAPGSLPELCLAQFREAKRVRREKLSSKELHHIATRLVDVAAQQGHMTERCVKHLQQLGKELGLGADAVRLFISKRLNRES